MYIISTEGNFKDIVSTAKSLVCFVKCQHSNISLLLLIDCRVWLGCNFLCIPDPRSPTVPPDKGSG